MVKYVPEKVLQYYFKDIINKKEPLPIYQKYTVEINGTQEEIDTVDWGEDFPDLKCTINGKSSPQSTVSISSCVPLISTVYFW
jgi:hypothetical protein